MGLGDALYQQFELGNLPVYQFSIQQLRWRDTADLQQQLLKHKPTLILNALPLELLQADQPEQDIVSCSKKVSEFCRQHSIKLLQLSSALVFAGGDKKAYDESEKPQVNTELGRALVACEEALTGDFEHWMLLRLTSVINTHGDNLFTHYLRELVMRGAVEVDPSVRLAPIWMDDALRVTATMVRQSLAGAENWGVYHYGSADPCSEKEFAQQLIDSIGELKPGWSAEPIAIAIEDQKKTSSVLKCRRVRNNFGVHGRTWRQGLKARIQFWLDSEGAMFKTKTASLSSMGGD